ncbi:MAG: hypothetical protein Q8O40_17165, partial [Chloroflexota bacterium]|nr:hypothetical protein [Chloroflexota bacterium]
MPPRRRMAISVAAALLTLIALGAGWRYAGPLYNVALATAGGALTGRYVAAEADGMELVLRYEGPVEEGPRWTRVHGLMLQYGALLVSALILASPTGAWRQRALGVLITWLCFTIVAILTVALLGWGLVFTVEGGPFTLAGLGSVLPVVYIGLPAVAGG